MVEKMDIGKLYICNKQNGQKILFNYRQKCHQKLFRDTTTKVTDKVTDK